MLYWSTNIGEMLYSSLHVKVRFLPEAEGRDFPKPDVQAAAIGKSGRSRPVAISGPFGPLLDGSLSKYWRIELFISYAPNKNSQPPGQLKSLKNGYRRQLV